MADVHSGLYLVEQRLPGVTESELALLQAALSSACVRLKDRGHTVIYLGSTYLPSSSRVLSLFEATGAEVVRRAADASQAPVVRLETAIRLVITDQED